MADNLILSPCFTRQDYNGANYSIVENPNGTVSIYDTDSNPITDHENKACCKALGYNFDIDAQKCLWVNTNNDGNDRFVAENCEFKAFKIVINPEGNSGTILNLDSNETCCLNISFDYLFNFECDVLENFINNSSLNSTNNNLTYIDIFENLDIRFNLEKIDQSTGRLETVFQESIFNISEGGLSDYIINNQGSTGLLIDGGCNTFKPTIQGQLLAQYQSNNETIPTSVTRTFNDWFNTCWLRYEREICSPSIIDDLTNENINISITVNNSYTDFSILLDRIKIHKNAEKIVNVETFISEPPKFDFERVPDNKKSWLANKVKENRDFDLKLRATEYVSNEQRLTINSKEIDLNLSPARAVEQDIWNYIGDNNCILEGCKQTGPFEPYSCPDGFEFDGSNLTVCVMSAFTNTIKVGNAYNVSSWYNFNRVNHYGLRGTIFIEEEVTDMVWPIYWTGTPENTWVGPNYNADYLTDSSGSPISATGFGTEFGQGNVIRWASPEAFSGHRSKFGSSESTTVGGVSNPNLLWGGTPGLNSMIMAGRLFNSAIWVQGTGINNKFFNNRWLGLSKCLEIETSMIYNIGFAGDDKVRIKVNGEWLINPDISPERPIGPNSGFDTIRPNSRFTQAYVVVPVNLFQGKNVIEVEGYNSTAGAPAGFVCEVYSASTTYLKTLLTESQLDEVTIFSTKDYIGQEFNVVGSEGYFCPTGYALDTCLPEPYQCLEINRVNSIKKEREICCCAGDPLVITSYNGITTQLSIDTLPGAILDCQDILDTYDSVNAIDIIKSECRLIYKIGDKTKTTFKGYYLTEENDGRVGVYDVNWLSGVTETYTSLNDLVDSECCEVISSIFLSDVQNNLQGVDIYPKVSWDTNLKSCVYGKFGDDGCINIDNLLTTEVFEIDTIGEFGRTLSSELIDVKNRQTISTYPTLRMLYDRYNFHALDYCDVDSSKLDYFDMDKFGNTVGDYWVDLMEQVIPATTIWNSTYEYRNTIFDQQKFQYRKSLVFNCTDPSGNYPFESVANDNSVDVILETLPKTSTTVSSVEECTGVWAMQYNVGSEFLGTVSIIGVNANGGSNGNVINEISPFD